MSGSAKKLLIVFLILGIVAGGLLLVASSMLSPDRAKSQIADWVERHTGRLLMIRGGVVLTFYPWIGFKIADATLANDPSFGLDPIAEIEEIGVKVKLLPLLQHRLEVDRVTIQGLYLNLARDRAGRGNWSGIQETLAGRGRGSPASPTRSLLDQTRSVTEVVSVPSDATTPPASPGKEGAALLTVAALTVDGIDITGAALRYQDDATDNSLALEELTIRVGSIRAGQPVRGDIETEWSLASPELAGSASLATELLWDDAKGSVQARNTQIKLTVTGNDLPMVENLQAVLHTEIQADLLRKTLRTDKTELRMDAQEGGKSTAVLNLKLSGDMTMDWAAESLQMADVRLTLLDHVQVRGTLDGRDIMHKPEFKSLLTAAEFVPQVVLQRLGHSSLMFQDPKVMRTASLETTLQAGPDHLALTGIKGRLDDTHLTGTLQVDHFQNPVVRFNLHVDQMDADRYQLTHAQGETADKGRPPQKRDDMTAVPGAGVQDQSDLESEEDDQLEGQVGRGGDARAEESDAYDSEQLHAATGTAQSAPPSLVAKGDIQGKVQVDQFKVQGVKLTGTDMTLIVGQGVVKVEPLRTQLYGGSVETQTQLDLHDQEPLLRMGRLALKGIDVGLLLRETGHPQPVSGRADGQIRLEARLAPGDAWRKTLSGTLQLVVHDGALEGIDLENRILTAYAALKQRPVASLPADRGKTPFTELTASATLRNGVADNQDLQAVSRVLNLQGAGQFDLVRQQMDYGIKARILPALEEIDPTAKDLQGFDIPIHLTGGFRQPAIRVDLARLLESALRTKAMDKVGNKLGEKLQDPKIQEKMHKLEKQLGTPLKKLLPF
ncbi:MAG: AsmA family protein [Magnetococcales bacterium]|nr:AsmA family protein [Magnetococcales bacterium]